MNPLDDGSNDPEQNIENKQISVEFAETQKKNWPLAPPQICSFHRRILMLVLSSDAITNHFNATASTQPPVQGAPNESQYNAMKMRRNRNPNCNHNNSSVRYQPTYNNIKFSDQYKRKEDALRRVLFNNGGQDPINPESNTVPNNPTNHDNYMKEIERKLQ